MTNSVMLLDFDNIFLGIWNQDRELARRFAQEPMKWLPRLEDSYLAADTRRWLVARCYLNPTGSVSLSNDPSDRLYFWRFRPALVNAGFEVVDCPVMTRAGKNAADIRIVIDALDLLYSRGKYEEFVIASGDSDFTPLLQRVRADDRRITIISPGQASLAYTALADRVLDFDAIEALVRPESRPTNVEPIIVGLSAQEAFASFVQTRYAEASAPLNLAALAQQASAAIPGAFESKWFGGGFQKAVIQIGLPHAQLSQDFLWDEERHQPPEERPQAADASQPEWASGMPEPVVNIVRLLDLPRLRAEMWPHVFRTLAEYAKAHDFNLTEATRWSRDTMTAMGVPVARPALGYVIRGAQMGGVSLDADTPPTAQEIASAFYDSLMDRARFNGFDFNEDAEEQIKRWLGLPPLEQGIDGDR